MCTGSVLLNPSASSVKANKDRMLKYKALAAAFLYPERKELVSEPRPFFKDEGECKKRRGEYDHLFRHSEIWLYGAEYIAENEFQRARILSDIAGFYKAFGLETDKDRPDMLVSELEFMYYLLYKEINAPDNQKAAICQDAQRKFFNEHLYPAAKKISKKIISQAKSGFYPEVCQNLLKFLESEKKVFAK